MKGQAEEVHGTRARELLKTVSSWWHQLLFCHVCDKDLLLKRSLKRVSQGLM